MYRILLSARYSLVWSWVIFYMIFEIILKGSLTFCFRTFFVKRLEVWNVEFFRKRDSVIDKLQIWVIGTTNILALSCKNLPEICQYRQLYLAQRFSEALRMLHNVYQYFQERGKMCQEILESVPWSEFTIKKTKRLSIGFPFFA